jgi:cell division protein FtsA
MSPRSIVTGIDIGTYQVKVVIASTHELNEKGFPRVLGTGIAETKGIRHGYVVNADEVAKSIHMAVKNAERVAKHKIKRAFVSIGGIGLGTITSTCATTVTRADSEITSLDIQKLHQQCEKDIPQNIILNKKIIHQIPIQYKIDGKPVLGKPEGMKANRLEVKMMYITCLEHHVSDILQAVESAGIDVQDVMASPIAASLVTLSKTQKIAGCVLANIGAETVSIAVFENNMPISLEVFPIGSTDITNDIALGLKVPLEEAEQIKVGAITSTSYPRKKLEDIIYARLTDIFELIEAHLKKIGRSGLLPAGIVITGGGSGLGTVDDFAKAALRLPARIGTIFTSTQEKENFKDSSWAVAYGLCILGINADEGPSLHNGAVALKRTKNTLIALFKQFLP